MVSDAAIDDVVPLGNTSSKESGRLMSSNCLKTFSISWVGIKVAVTFTGDVRPHK